MLRALDDLVESRIRDALERGEFDALPGSGRPLPAEDLTGVPDDLRIAVRILKNAGCVPVELEALRDRGVPGPAMARQDRLPADAARDAPGERDARRRGERRLVALTRALEARGMGTAASALREYRGRLVARLGR
jgi:hypothetical protein